MTNHWISMSHERPGALSMVVINSITLKRRMMHRDFVVRAQCAPSIGFQYHGAEWSKNNAIDGMNLRRRANQPDKANHIWVIRSWQIFNELKAKHCWFASRFACPRTVRRVWIMFATSRRLHIRSEHQAGNLEQWRFTDEPSGKSSENSVLRDLAVLTDVRVQNYSL